MGRPDPSGDTSNLTVTIGANFPGSDSFFAGLTPPDSDGAIGPGYFVELVNGSYSVYTPSGALVQRSSQLDFWLNAGLMPDGSGFDPRIIYDPQSGRWFAAAITPTSFLLAVSNTSDPTQGWHAVSIQVATGSPKSPDYTALGVNEQGVYLEASNDWYIVAIPKADLVQQTPSASNAVLFTSNQDPVTPGLPGFVAQPAVAPFLAGSEPFISAANWDTGEIRISSVDWSGDVPALNATDRGVTVAPMQQPVDAPQLGSDVAINTTFTDRRFSPSAVYQDGKLFEVQTVLATDGRDVLRWYEIGNPLTTPTLVASGDVSPPGLDVYYGSIAVNPLGEVVIGFNGSSSQQYVSSYAIAGMLTSDGIQFGDPILLSSGSAAYLGGRWGDWSTTTFDPADPTHFWTIQELPSADNAWQTQITELTVPTPPPSPPPTLTPLPPGPPPVFPLNPPTPPVFPLNPPTSNTWTDSTGNHEANDPNNWSSGTPQPGETLLLPDGGTISIRDNDLQGDPLVLATQFNSTATETLKLSHHANVTLETGAETLGFATAVINVKGHDTLHLIAGTAFSPPYHPHAPLSATVNLASHARLDGSFDLGFRSRLTVSGDDHAKFINSGTDTVSGATVSIDAHVLGSGLFRVTAGGLTPTSSSGGQLTFGSTVSKGQVVDVTGAVAGTSPPRTRISSVTIGDPNGFRGTLDLHDHSLADLAGLAHADAWCYKNDMLSILDGHGRVLDRLHIISDAASTGGVNGLSVARSATGDILITPGADFRGSLDPSAGGSWSHSGA